MQTPEAFTIKLFTVVINHKPPQAKVFVTVSHPTLV